MPKITIVGNVHSQINVYLEKIKKFPRTIQIGDMGVGFPGVFLPHLGIDHQWFRGNHDWPEKCRQHPDYLGDYGYLPEDRLFWVAGAASIDRESRIRGLSWWEDEQLSYQDLKEVIDEYERVKPEFVLSHEAPRRAGANLLYDLIGPYFAAKGGCLESRTSIALQAMFEIHQPREWVFGHYHVDKTFFVQGARTKFTCVGAGPGVVHTYDLETGNGKERKEA